jgi:hypothetical protein
VNRSAVESSNERRIVVVPLPVVPLPMIPPPVLAPPLTRSRATAGTAGAPVADVRRMLTGGGAGSRRVLPTDTGAARVAAALAAAAPAATPPITDASPIKEAAPACDVRLAPAAPLAALITSTGAKALASVPRRSGCAPRAGLRWMLSRSGIAIIELPPRGCPPPLRDSPGPLCPSPAPLRDSPGPLCPSPAPLRDSPAPLRAGPPTAPTLRADGAELSRQPRPGAGSAIAATGAAGRPAGTAGRSWLAGPAALRSRRKLATLKPAGSA